MRRLAQLGLVVALLLLGLAGRHLLVTLGPEPATEVVAVPPPLVDVVAVLREDVALAVESQGTVRPRAEAAIVSEVSGRVVFVAPALSDGGFLESGEVMVRIDRRDFELAVTEAEAAVARAALRMATEEAAAEVALSEWERLGKGEPTALVARRPQLVEARASLAAAEAGLERARRDVERCTLRAPFDARVARESVEAGQFVTRGLELARLHAVDAVEVVLPLPDGELAYLDLPLGFDDLASGGPPVTLHARFAGRDARWAGRVVRIGSELDPRTRAVPVVVRVEDPYGRREDRAGPPLPVGLHVRASIAGRLARDVAVLPRAAMRDDSTVLVVHPEPSTTEVVGPRTGRLSLRRVEVVRRGRESVLVSSGLEEGELACVTPLEAATEGMLVRFELDGEAGPSARDGQADRLGS